MWKLIKKWDLSIAYRLFLILLDILFINISSFLALWVRFNMHIEEIPPEYYTSVLNSVIPNTIFTLIIFAICRLYTSLWRYASIKELVYHSGVCHVYAAQCAGILSDLPSDIPQLFSALRCVSFSPHMREQVLLPSGETFIPEQSPRNAYAQYDDYRRWRSL